MKVRVRMYRQGLGDCFLLTFDEGPAAKHVLIDCGTLGATTTGVAMADVVQHIHDQTGGHLTLLVATHEHKDHVSGFLTRQATFDQIQVDHVWLAWTEDAEDDLAKELQKHKGDLLSALKLAAATLEKNDAPFAADRKATAEVGSGIRKLLAFYDEEALGAKLATTINEAMDWVTRKMFAAGDDFLLPGGEAIEPEWLPGWRFYVLGPPHDKKALANMGEHGSPELYELGARQAASLMASVAFFAAGESLEQYYAGLEPDDRQELARGLPFDLRHRLEAHDREVQEQYRDTYYRDEDAWRRIDYDWLGSAADLALQLDSQTNNTSLALAIERIADGRVLLFPADAQVGNWLSWHADAMKWKVKDAAGVVRQVTAKELLARTVLYKVGHHASHNATIREQGLELMASPELTAMIPVDRAVAIKKTPPWQMPARGLYKRLLEKTQGRVLRSDVGWARPDADFKKLFTAQEWSAFEAQQQATMDAKRVEIDKLDPATGVEQPGSLFIDFVLD